MTKKDLIKAVSAKAGFSQGDVKTCIDALIEVTEETLVAGEDISIVGFGKMDVKERSARTCRNPQNGELMEVPSKKAVRFKAGRTLVDKVNA